jgi:amidohydrolase
MSKIFAERVTEEVSAIEAELIEARRHLHQWPELSHQESETGRFLLAQLQLAKIQARGNVGGHGVIAEIEGARPGPTLAFRADMDALPIHENNPFPFASKNVGVMHACGHDAHMTIGLGVARVFQSLRNELIGKVRVFFQPAEESVPSGAEKMIEAGVLENVSGVWMVHVEPALPPGLVGLRCGPVTAATDAFTITVIGKGGHSARPHLSRDANFVAAQILSGIYQMASTQFDPREPMVVNVGVLQGGSAPNAIAGRATLDGVIRTLSPAARPVAVERFETLVKGIAAAHGCEVILNIRPGSPSQVNDPHLTRLTESAAREMLGENSVIEIPLPSLGGEDFSRYTQKCPGVLVRVGNAIAGKEVALHSENFELEESIMGVGVRVIAQTLYRAAHLISSR